MHKLIQTLINFVRIADKRRVKSISFFLLLFQFSMAYAGAADSVRSVCEADANQKREIESCQAEMQSELCEDLPSEQKKDCFDPVAYQNPIQGRISCAKGAWAGVKETVAGVYEIGSRLYSGITDNKGYKKRVQTETLEACEKDKEVIKARDRYKSIVQNIGLDAAAMGHLSAMQAVYQKCYHREKQKGEAFGVAFELPKSDDVKSLLFCLNSEAQTETICKIIAPMVAGGVTGAAIKAGIKKAYNAKKFGASEKQIGKALDDYVERARKEGSLSPAELKSLAHQTDLINGIKNPEIAARIQAAGVDLDALTKGILDSDYGKLSAGKKLLMTESPDSNMGLNILKGQDKKSHAGRAYQQHLKAIGQANKSDLPAHLSNEEIRRIISEKPILNGQMHELPGMIRAFKEHNEFMENWVSAYKRNFGRAPSSEQLAELDQKFVERLNANRGHNHSPISDSGRVVGMGGNQIRPFWDQIEQDFIPAALRGDPARHRFYEGTLYDVGRKTDDGIVIPKYPAPTQKSVFVHSVFDRLSQGTGGGNVKIFYEVAGKAVAENPKLPMGSANLNMLGNNLTGNIVKQKGIAKQTFSNGEATNVQFKGLLEALDRSPYSVAEKGPLRELIRAGRDRNLAYDDFAKNNISYVKDADGNVKSMSLKDSKGNYIGKIDESTPTDEAMNLLNKFNKAEERFNGDPFSDLMKPRLLTKSEKAAYGLTGAGPFYYCNKKKVTEVPAPPNQTDQHFDHRVFQ